MLIKVTTINTFYTDTTKTETKSLKHVFTGYGHTKAEAMTSVNKQIKRYEGFLLTISVEKINVKFIANPF